MMSQQRVRKPVGIGDAVTRSSVVKAAGDTVPCARPNTNERSRSKNKIPKTIRYDLETALVGLCDVWFEEIKPHLIRNNIKLHVDGIGGAAGPAAGDHKRPPAPLDPQPKCCDHLDPGAAPDRRPPLTASCAGYCSTQPTASRAPSRKPPVSLPSTHLQAPITCNSMSSNKKRRGRSIKRKPSSESASPAARAAAWQAVRACRTYSVLRAAPAPAPAPPHVLACATRVRTAELNKPKSQQTKKNHKNNKELKKPRRKTRTCSTWTQTEPAYLPELASLKVSKRNSSIQCDRCPGNTALNKKTKDKQYRVSDTTKHDSYLDNLIAELEDKRLHLLYESPHRDECQSAVNLIPMPYVKHFARKKKPLKNPPWK